MEKKNNATNALLCSIDAADGRTLARLLLLTLIRSDALCEQLAASTITRWAERRFAAEPLFAVLRTLHDGALHPLLVLDTMLHPPRLLLLGASAPMLDVVLSADDSAPIDFCAALFVLAKRHATYAAHIGSLSHVWDVSSVFCEDDVLLKSSRMLGAIVAGKIGARMGFDPARWDALCARVRPVDAPPRAELKRAYESALSAPARVGDVAALPKKKKKISQRKAPATRINE